MSDLSCILWMILSDKIISRYYRPSQSTKNYKTNNAAINCSRYDVQLWKQTQCVRCLFAVLTPEAPVPMGSRRCCPLHGEGASGGRKMSPLMLL